MVIESVISPPPKHYHTNSEVNNLWQVNMLNLHHSRLDESEIECALDDTMSTFVSGEDSGWFMDLWICHYLHQIQIMMRFIDLIRGRVKVFWFWERASGNVRGNNSFQSSILVMMIVIMMMKVMRIMVVMVTKVYRWLLVQSCDYFQCLLKLNPSYFQAALTPYMGLNLVYIPKHHPQEKKTKIWHSKKFHFQHCTSKIKPIITSLPF